LAYACHLVSRLPSSSIGGKTPLEIWSEKVAQDYDLLQVFECPAYYHVKKDKLNSRARKYVFVGFKKEVKGYKIWDPKDRKFIWSRDATFDEASMVNPTYFQQVKSLTTGKILQQVESDATSLFLDRSISLWFVPSVIQSGDQVAEQDSNADDEIKDML